MIGAPRTSILKKDPRLQALCSLGWQLNQQVEVVPEFNEVFRSAHWELLQAGVSRLTDIEPIRRLTAILGDFGISPPYALWVAN